MKRRIVEFLLIVIGFILQSTLFKTLSLGGVAPNLILMFTSFFGFMKGKKEGMFAGFIAGILTDIFFGNGVVGLYALIFTWIGYGNGMFNRLFYPEDIKLPLILTTVSDFLYGFLAYVFLFLLRKRLDMNYYVLHIILPEIVYTLIATIILYRPVLFIEQWLESSEELKRTDV